MVEADITVNKNMVPFDDKSPFVTSGMRIGTAAVTTRGMKEQDMSKIVNYIDKALMSNEDQEVLDGIKSEINTWMAGFPLYK